MASREARSYTQKSRDRIQGTKALTRLINYVEADPDDAKEIMSAGQCNVALALLKKVLPDLSQQTLTVQEVEKIPRQMSLAELMEEFESGKQNTAH